MADKVQRVLEDMVPELLDLGKRKVFTKDEIKEIIRNRRAYEYKISSRTPILKDYLEYLNYEYEIERIRHSRTRELRLKKRTIGDYSVIRLIHFIFKRALRKFPSDEKLWLQNIDFCLKSGSSKALQRNLIAALRNNPTKSIFWLLMSDRELQNGNLKEARSSILLGLRVNKESLLLWRGFVQLEINIAYKQFLSSFKSKSLSPKKLNIKDPSVVSLLPMIQFSHKKFKNNCKREAFIIYIFRQYYKLKTAILEDNCDISIIKGMNELENTILSNINEMKKSQPLFSVFSILIKIINVKDDKLNLFDLFKDEMELVMNNSDIKYILLTLLFICRLICNCTLKGTHFSENKSDIVLSENDHDIVDFGFQITDTFDFKNVKNNEMNCSLDDENSTIESEFNITTWYSQTCIENIASNEKHYFENIIELIRLDPNFWNACLLENIDINVLLNLSSKYHNVFEESVSNREVCKDTLLNIELINILKNKIKNCFTNELNLNKMREISINILNNINKLEITDDFLVLKFSLTEAFESLFYKKGTEYLMSEKKNQTIFKFDDNMDNIHTIIKTIKSYIGNIGNLKINDVNNTLFVINLTNKLFDLIKFQVEINENKVPVLFDFTGFVKCVCWLYLILTYNIDSFDHDLRIKIEETTERIINDSLGIVPSWLESRNIPNYVFNVILLHSIIHNAKINNKKLFYELFLEYLNNNEAKIDIKLDYYLLMEMLSKYDNIDSDIMLDSIKSIFCVLEKNEWIFNNDIKIISRQSKNITGISFKLVCITLMCFVYKKYISYLIYNEDNNKVTYLLNYNENVLSKLFLLWESLMKDCEDIKDKSDEFYLSIVVNYLLFLKFIDYLKLKRYLPPTFCKNSVNHIGCTSDLIRIIRRTNQLALTRKLYFGFNLGILQYISPVDPKFILFIDTFSNNIDIKTNRDDNMLNNEKETLKTISNLILSSYNIINSTFSLIQNNYS
ncbi:hypothetical protein RS030_169 [Cryptosporidium xiaoi]|uniref:U3 small nucleolar RNA-associated protein 6 N-terminal domain-containing protein n=1 Tax=Cryptosporidium xiaoi TaxID=659607 RepID=A0AAV9Y1T5_9CRYT